MATLSEMRDRVLDGVKRPGFTDATEIDRLINQSYKELVARTRPKLATYAATLASGVADYTQASLGLSTTFVGIRRIQLGGSPGGIVEAVSREYLIELQRTSAVSAQVSYYSVDGSDSISFYPTPSENVAVTITTVVAASDLVVDADTPSLIAEPFHDTIVLFAIAKAVRVWNPSYGRLYHDAAMQSLGEYRQWLNRTSGTWLAKAVVRGSRTRNRGLDNDVYISGMG